MNEVRQDESIFERLGAIWARRKRLILSIFALVAIPGICATVALPSIYEASATVIPVGDLGTLSRGGSEAAAIDSINEQVLSRSRLADLIERFDLYPSHGAAFAYPASRTEAMRKDVEIDTRRGGDARNAQPIAIAVTYRGSDARKVAAVTNALARSYADVAGQVQARQASARARTLKSRLAAVQKKLDTQQESISRFRKRHPGALPEEQNVSLATMQRLNTQLRNNEAQQRDVMDRRASLLGEMEASGGSTLSQLEQRLADLKLSYTDKYPAVVALKHRIAALKNQQGAAGNGTDPQSQSPLEQQLESVDQNLADLKTEERQLERRIAVYQTRLDNAPESAQQLKGLTRGYSETSELYGSLLKEYEQARVAAVTAGKTGPQFEVFESAEVPRKPVGPGRFRLLVASLMLGIGLAGGVAMAKEHHDTSFHGLRDLQAFTSVPVLATVPVVATTTDRWRRRVRAGLFALGVLCAVAVVGGGAYLYSHDNQAVAQSLTHRGG